MAVPVTASYIICAVITAPALIKLREPNWEYTVPAFLVPFMFVLDPSGQGLLLMGSSKALATANWWSIAEVTFTAALGVPRWRPGSRAGH